MLVCAKIAGKYIKGTVKTTEQHTHKLLTTSFWTVNNRLAPHL